ncbi:tRNA pseudouridine(55) synthase TruB [Cellulomonas shaoxiangyii]|uniref:tRNA pseudouridine synthase B n=1 Tax=Cellulomonas shaoxiangyii TaxID=2566013 RepID=A0A4P7SMX8_9CELL|nr:tRNA pseudouridine(55) synthase TruB [Cellulomonas shaoxiangyii]QCB93953.1 tRNA pseudouridine(55) synthase TruB [Cellulomonas shaoxiangyii]TGY86026.1 tRNA pseudouridine(55) synthase TruB [Cellulomonas shaoxiangyii]
MTDATAAPASDGRGDRQRRGPRDDGRPRRPTADDGVLVVDKPAGWTSHDVVARVRRLASTRKVGHAGTLDPMATGVLVLGVGRATRLLTYVTGADKDYTATVRLGVRTSTEDAEGETLGVVDASAVTPDAVAAAAAALTGDLLQVPSAVSAIKVDGQRAYARVRAGEHVELAARPVTVPRFDVLAARTASATGGDGADVTVLDVDVAVTCSSGTYVRALARDLGDALGVGGHLTALRRTRVGGYGLAVARTLDDLAAAPDDVAVDVLPMAAAARAAFPVRELTEREARALSYGQGVPVGDAPDGPVAAIAPDGALVAVVSRRGDLLRPEVVLAPAG